MAVDAGHISHTEAPERAGLKAFLKAAILLGLGFYFADMVFSDKLKNYSNQPEWLTLGAAGLFTLLGLTSIASFLATRTRSVGPGQAEVEQHNHAHEHSHDHKYTSWAVVIIVAIPLVVGKLVPSKPLGAAAMNSSNLSGSTLAVQRSSGPAVAEPQAWNVMEWQLAMWHNIHPPEWFVGRKVDVIGFVVRQPGVPAGNFLVGRFIIYHCVADARGVALLVDWPGADKLPLDTWVRVQGTMKVETIGQGPTLHVYATHVDDKIGQPESPYLRPFLRNDNPEG